MVNSINLQGVETARPQTVLVRRATSPSSTTNNNPNLCISVSLPSLRLQKGTKKGLCTRHDLPGAPGATQTGTCQYPKAGG